MVKIKVLNPVMPSNDRDPVGAGRKVLSAYRVIDGAIKSIYSGVAKRINDIPRTEVSVNDLNKATRKYIYEIDPMQMQDISTFIQQLVNKELLGNDTGLFSDLFFLNNGIETEYIRATENAIQSTKNLASANVVGSELSRQIRAIETQNVLLSMGYQRRIGLAKSRVFEEMDGLTSAMKKDISGILGRGMAAGHGVNRIKREIRMALEGKDPEKSGGHKYRAERIARTEINNAYRTAYQIETDEVNNNVWKGTKFVTRLLWYSALAEGRTRKTHARRHGRVYTTTEVSNFYSIDGNAINCLCNQVSVLVRKKDGRVMNSELIEEMKKQREMFVGGKGA